VYIRHHEGFNRAASQDHLSFCPHGWLLSWIVISLRRVTLQYDKEKNVWSAIFIRIFSDSNPQHCQIGGQQNFFYGHVKFIFLKSPQKDRFFYTLHVLFWGKNFHSLLAHQSADRKTLDGLQRAEQFAEPDSPWIRIRDEFFPDLEQIPDLIGYYIVRLRLCSWL
jgi:hypothetical protein